MRRDGRGRGRRPGRTSVVGVSSQVDLHAEFGGVVPEIASRAPSTDRAGDRRGARRGGRRLATSTPSPSRHGPGLAGALLVGVSAAKAIARWRPTSRTSASTTSRAPLRGQFSRNPEARAPLPVLIVSGGHTLLSTSRTRPLPWWARRSTTPRARRSTRSRGSSGSATRAVR